MSDDRDSTPLVIQMARPADAPQMLDIYAPLVRETVISFEVQAPDVQEFADRVCATLSQWPWLLCRAGQRVAGYAYASQHRHRHAYQWSAEVSVYVQADYRRRGIARRLYTTLFELLRRQGYVHIYAGITLPNPASVQLHESLGFAHLGTYSGIGFKFGAWHDVGWWSLALRSTDGPPPTVRSIHELLAEPEALRELLPRRLD